MNNWQSLPVKKEEPHKQAFLQENEVTSSFPSKILQNESIVAKIKEEPAHLKRDFSSDESTDDEKYMSTEEKENFNYHQENKLNTQIELIYRKLIDSGELKDLRKSLIRELYIGRWKYEMFNLCKAALQDCRPGDKPKKIGNVTFQQLYGFVKMEALEMVDPRIRLNMIQEVKRYYAEALKK